jgi:hypothetical protein
MNSIQVADQTFVAADPSRSAGRRRPGELARWWPDLLLTVVEDRGQLGHRWTVHGA